MYRVLLSMIDGQRKATLHLTDLKVEGAIKHPAAASLLMEKHEKDEALVTSFELGDTERDAEPASADKKRHKKKLTPEQEEARKVKAEKTRKTLFMKKQIQMNKFKVESTIAKLTELPETGSSGITAQIASLQSIVKPLQNFLTTSNLVLAEEKLE